MCVPCLCSTFDNDADCTKVRMIKDIELDKLKYWYFDGRTKLDPPYEA